MIRRQQTSLLFILLASLPAIGSGQALAQTSVSPAADPQPIAPPLQPMIYTRRLERSLTGDTQIVVERKFAIHFVPMPTGYRVEGEQIAVDVQTPEQLAFLAKLERERVERGIFPLELDRQGHIRSGELAPPSPEIDEALREITARLRAIEPVADERQTLSDFVEAIHAAGTNITSRLPEDLFAPAASERSDSHIIALPRGGEGEVSTMFTARRDSITGLMSSARREVISVIDGSSRHTIETFTLVRQGPDLCQGIIIPLRKGA